MMPKWLLVTLRCWIAFIAFTNFGAAFRCFTDEKFLQTKFFGMSEDGTYQTIDPSVIERMHGHWSLLNGMVLLNTFFFLDEKKIIGMAICTLSLYLCFFFMEGFIFKTIIVHGPTIYPCVLSGLTLFWLCAGYKYLCGSGSVAEEVDENEVLRKQFPYKGGAKKKQ